MRQNQVTGIDSCESYLAFGQRVRTTVRQRSGLTCGIGIAQTLTLAKLANHAAKTWPATGGVVDLSNHDRQRKLMALLPVNETWGIGRKLSEKLNAMGIKTVLQLADANLNLMKKTFGVVVERTIRELNGTSCISIEALPAKQQIICSRSFGERITQLQDMRQAVCQYAERAAEKLRQERQYCKHVSVFLRRTAGYVAGRKRGREVLAQCADRTKKPRPERYPHRLCRRPERLPGRHQHGVSGSPHPAVHRTYGAQQPAVRLLEGLQSRHPRPESHLSGPHGRSRPAGAGSVRQCLGQPLPADKPELAGKLGQPGDVLRLPGGHPQGYLHNECHRVAEQRDPACYQEAQGVPDGRRSEKGGVAGNPGGITEMDDAAEGLAYGDEPLYYRVRRPPGRPLLRKGIYTESCTGSDSCFQGPVSDQVATNTFNHLQAACICEDPCSLHTPQVPLSEGSSPFDHQPLSHTF